MGLYDKPCRDCGVIIQKPALLCEDCKDVVKEKGKAEAKRVRQALVLFKAQLKAGGCAVCGYNKCAVAIDFHHLFGKKDGGVSKLHSVGAIKREIANNDIVLLCATCHRELHAGLIEESELLRSVIII